MTTIVEALTDATAELHAAALLYQGRADQVALNLAATTGQTTTIVNNFLARPPVVTLFLDPVAGVDTRDGSTPALAKQSIDNVLDAIGTTATSIVLLSDATIRRRRNVYASLDIRGGQPANNAAGYMPIQRNLYFLATAENSPSPSLGTFCSGLWLLGPGVTADRINFNIPDQPAQDYTAHITSNAGCNLLTNNCALFATSGAGSLIGSSSNTINFFGGLILGTGAAGHLFQGVASGANPNSLFQYRTNITSA